MVSPSHRFFKYRLALLISMIVLVPTGLIVRFSQGWGSPWLPDFLGALAYEIFFVLAVLFVFPQTSPRWAAVGIFWVTCALEFLQLWQSPFWQAVRATLPGRLLFGNTFSWADFPSYLVGSGLGWLWGRSLSLRWR